MSKLHLTFKLTPICTFLIVILIAFACHQGEVFSPEPSGKLGMANPTFVRVLPGEKGAPRPMLSQSHSSIISASEGGTLTCGHATLVFPSGSLSEDTEITIVIPDLSVLVAEFGPDGLEFNEAVIMRWDLIGTTAEGEAETVGTLRFNDQTQLWEEIPMLAPPDPNTTETELEHFSKYGQEVGG